MKEKKTGVYSMYYLESIFIVAALLLFMPICALSAAPAISGGMDFEIPLSELSKGNKESPPKRVASTHKKKKKSGAGKKKTSVAASQRALTDTIEPIQHTVQAKFLDSNPDAVAPGKAIPKNIPITSGPIPENIQIDHNPYSFVVSGKSTVIQAVIYRREADLRAVNCKTRVIETGAHSLVKMGKVAGTKFTYAATLPGVAPNVSSLRYTIVAIDPVGRESVSPEFVTPVTSSPVVPGWQF